MGDPLARPGPSTGDPGDAAPGTADAEPVALEDLVPSPAALEPRPHEREPSLRTARLLRVEGRAATIALRGARDPIEATIADEVDVEVVEEAAASGDAVLVERVPGEAPIVVGTLRTRRPREIHVRGATVHIEGDDEVLLRSGRGAIRIRADGEVEVVGSRISASSRGIFRIIGRILRLN
jgi:hypothetical protein